MFYSPIVPANDSSNIQNFEESLLEDVGAPVPVVSKKTYDANGSASKKNVNQINITNNLYTLVLSNLSGGSIQRFSLKEPSGGSLRHVGGYIDKDYDAISPTEFLNTDEPCAPCLGFVDSKTLHTFFVSMPFTPIEGFRRDVVLDSNQSFSIKSVYTFSNQTVGGAEYEGIKITKETVFSGNSFEIEHIFFIEGASELIQNPQIFWLAELNPTEKNISEDRQYSSAIINQGGTVTHYTVGAALDDKLESSYLPGTTNWVAVRNKYFIASLIFNSPFDFARVEAENSVFINDETFPVFRLSAGKNNNSNNALSCKMYIGPLDIDHIRKTNTNLEDTMNFGWKILHPISKGILWILKKAYLVLPNYGFILIGFALLVRFATGPLTRKSHESSKKMSEIQPALKKIQTKYKNDSQKLNSEMMKLYKNSGVNPLGGCLPLLLQMPLLYSLFIVFRSTIEFRGEPFILWITDLSKPDFVFSLPFSIPLYGNAVAILPILMGITLVLTMQMSANKMDPAQKPIMYIMPIFFTLIFNTFPSGLNLYYTCYNILNYMQQRSIHK